MIDVWEERLDDALVVVLRVARWIQELSPRAHPHARILLALEENDHCVLPPPFQDERDRPRMHLASTAVVEAPIVQETQCVLVGKLPSQIFHLYKHNQSEDA